MDLAAGADQAAALVQLARAVGELGDPTLFDLTIDDAWRLVDARPGTGLTSPYALHEVHLRGLAHTGRPDAVTDLLDRHRMSTTAIPPQWQAIPQITAGEVLLARADAFHAVTALRAAIAIAEDHRYHTRSNGPRERRRHSFPRSRNWRTRPWTSCTFPSRSR